MKISDLSNEVIASHKKNGDKYAAVYVSNYSVKDICDEFDRLENLGYWVELRSITTTLQGDSNFSIMRLLVVGL